jgi:hypothetical protein
MDGVNKMALSPFSIWRHFVSSQHRVRQCVCISALYITEKRLLGCTTVHSTDEVALMSVRIKVLRPVCDYNLRIHVSWAKHIRALNSKNLVLCNI